MSCCLCYPKVTGCSSTSTPKCPSGNCLVLPHLLVGSEVSVGPCGEQGFIPFEDTGLKTELCGLATPQFKIISYAPIFEDVSINSSGITFTTTQATSNASAGVIQYAVTCGKYGEYATATIILKNLCAGKICDANEFCDKCTGNCEPIPGGIKVGGTSVTTPSGGINVI